MSHLNLILLPDIVLENIFGFLSYDSIAQNRVVCRKFNLLGAKMLNRGYYLVDKFHDKTLKAIKAKLPRRESERRVHPLARQCDILIAIETRLSMLAMTFSKWIDAKLCCFIPGKVIDEIMRVIRYVAENPEPLRAHEILQELRDISSMAMEHFDEKILPALRLSVKTPSYLTISESGCLTTGGTRLSPEDLLSFKTRITSIQPHKAALFSVFQESILRKKIKKLSSTVAKQQTEIAELKKHMEEYDAKLRDFQEKISKTPELEVPPSVIVPRVNQKRKMDSEGNETDMSEMSQPKILRSARGTTDDVLLDP